jgi:hypothetical protein
VVLIEKCPDRLAYCKTEIPGLLYIEGEGTEDDLLRVPVSEVLPELSSPFRLIRTTFTSP